jgi:hypothetical protein
MHNAAGVNLLENGHLKHPEEDERITVRWILVLAMLNLRILPPELLVYIYLFISKNMQS